MCWSVKMRGREGGCGCIRMNEREQTVEKLINVISNCEKEGGLLDADCQ